MSSKSSMRIVLVDPLGEVLFSGESLSVQQAEPVAGPDSSEAVTERCPETLRSAGSGVYRAVDRTSVHVTDDAPETEDAPVIEDAGAQIRHVSSKKRSGRAA